MISEDQGGTELNNADADRDRTQGRSENITPEIARRLSSPELVARTRFPRRTIRRAQLDSATGAKASWRRKEEIETGTRYSRGHRYRVSRVQTDSAINSSDTPAADKGGGGGGGGGGRK